LVSNLLLVRYVTPVLSCIWVINWLLFPFLYSITNWVKCNIVDHASAKHYLTSCSRLCDRISNIPCSRLDEVIRGLSSSNFPSLSLMIWAFHLTPCEFAQWLRMIKDCDCGCYTMLWLILICLNSRLKFPAFPLLKKRKILMEVIVAKFCVSLTISNHPVAGCIIVSARRVCLDLCLKSQGAYQIHMNHDPRFRFFYLGRQQAILVALPFCQLKNLTNFKHKQTMFNSLRKTRPRQSVPHSLFYWKSDLDEVSINDTRTLLIVLMTEK
jgi:hypothetical protein